VTAVDSEQDRILDFEGFPGRQEMRKTAAKTGGDLFETRTEVEDSGELSPHKRPIAEESCKDLSVALEVQVDGEWTELTAGGKHVVPPGTAHAFRVTAPVEMINVHKPALRHEEYFRRFHKLKTDRCPRKA